MTAEEWKKKFVTPEVDALRTAQTAFPTTAHPTDAQNSLDAWKSTYVTPITHATTQPQSTFDVWKSEYVNPASATRQRSSVSSQSTWGKEPNEFTNLSDAQKAYASLTPYDTNRAQEVKQLAGSAWMEVYRLGQQGASQAEIDAATKRAQAYNNELTALVSAENDAEAWAKQARQVSTQELDDLTKQEKKLRQQAQERRALALLPGVSASSRNEMIAQADALLKQADDLAVQIGQVRQSYGDMYINAMTSKEKVDNAVTGLFVGTTQSVAGNVVVAANSGAEDGSLVAHLEEQVAYYEGLAAKYKAEMDSLGEDNPGYYAAKTDYDNAMTQLAQRKEQLAAAPRAEAAYEKGAEWAKAGEEKKALGKEGLPHNLQVGNTYVSDVLYDAASMAIEQGMDIVLNAALPGSMGGFALRAYGGAYLAAKENNATATQASAYAASVAAIEVLTEKLFSSTAIQKLAYGKAAIGSVEDIMEGAVKSLANKLSTKAGQNIAYYLGKMGLAASGEFLEELIGNVMEYKLPTIYGGDTQSFTEALSDGVMEGLTAAVSAVFGAATTPSNYKYSGSDEQMKSIVQKTLKKYGVTGDYVDTTINTLGAEALGWSKEGYDALIQEAREVGTDTSSRNFANQLAQKLQKGEELTMEELGLLRLSNEANSGGNTFNVAQKVRDGAVDILANSGYITSGKANLEQATNAYKNLTITQKDGTTKPKMSEKQAAQKAAIIMKVQNGKTLTPVEVRALNLSNKDMRDAFNKLTGLHLDESVNQMLASPTGAKQVSELIDQQIQENYSRALQISNNMQSTASLIAGSQASQDVAANEAAGDATAAYTAMQKKNGKPALSAKAAAQKAAIADKAMRGERLTRAEVTELNLSDPAYRAAFDRATGMNLSEQIAKILETGATARNLSQISNLIQTEAQKILPAAGDAEEGKTIEWQGQKLNYDQFKELVQMAALRMKKAPLTEQELRNTFENTYYNQHKEEINSGRKTDNGGLQGNADQRAGGDGRRLSGAAGRAEAQSSGWGAFAYPGGAEAQRGNAGVRNEELAGSRGSHRASEREKINLEGAPTETVKDQDGRVVMSVIDDDVFAQSQTAKNLADKYASIGASIHGIIGSHIRYDSKGKAHKDTGVAMQNGDTYVQLDNGRYSGTQIGGHELGHQIIFRDEQTYTDGITQLKSLLTDEEYDNLYQFYYDIWGDIYFEQAQQANPNAGVEEIKRRVQRIINEEILSDIYGKIDRYGAKKKNADVSRFHDKIAPIFEAGRQRIADSLAQGVTKTTAEEITAQNATQRAIGKAFETGDRYTNGAYTYTISEEGDRYGITVTDASNYGKQFNFGYYNSREEAVDAVRMAVDTLTVTHEDRSAGADTPENHIDNRKINDVSARSMKAFSYDHPELLPFYITAARALKEDLAYAYSHSGLMPVHRRTTNGIQRGAYIRTSSSALDLLRSQGMTLPQIDRTLDALVTGESNTADVKRAEIALDYMLTRGYRMSDGTPFPANKEYIKAKSLIPGGSTPVEVALRIYNEQYDLVDALYEPTEEELARRDVERDAIINDPQYRYSIDDTPDYAPVFYSKLEKEVEAFKGDRIGASSLVSYLKGRGVKSEEIRWSGVETYLEGKKSVSKAELLEWLDQNRQVITVEQHGGKETIDYTPEEKAALEAISEKMSDLVGKISELYESAYGEELPWELFGSDDMGGYVAYSVRGVQHNFDDSALTEQEQQILDYANMLSDAEGEQSDIVTAAKMRDTYGERTIDYRGQIVSVADFKRRERKRAAAENMNIVFTDHGRSITYEYIDKDTGELLNTMEKPVYVDKDMSKKREAKWGQYSLDGGENYREYLYKLPGSDYTNDAMQAHWRDSGVLAHARVQDFASEFEPVLFIDEIQSDWHNAGQKNGYSTSYNVNNRERIEDLQRKMNALEVEINGSRDAVNHIIHKAQNAINETASPAWPYMRVHRALYGGENGEYAKDYREAASNLTQNELDLIQQYEEQQQEWGKLADEQNMLEYGAPDAPYSKTYHEYVLKNLLRNAAEGGYQWLAWTPGWMQEERWSDRYAEGYRIEYDQDIPKFLNKYGKQWGARVEQISLDGLDNVSVPAIHINDAMQRDVLYKGQPLYSVDDYSEAEMQEHVAQAMEYFGTTSLWNETGYLLRNGKQLDFSGRKNGGPGGYRTVDHRDITDALGDDYGGTGYADGVIQFMSEGNIRILPEICGINLMVEPTEAQYQALRRYITLNKSKDGVFIDYDNRNGMTVRSTEYNKTDSTNKIIDDIKQYFKENPKPKSIVAQFHERYSPDDFTSEDVEKYTSPEAKERWANDPRFTNYKNKDLAWIAAASMDQKVVTESLLMAEPKIAEAQRRISEAVGDSISDHPIGSDPEADKKRAKVLHDFLNLGSYVKKDDYSGPTERGKKAFIILGPPAAGKSSVFANPLSKEHKAKILDGDVLKSMLDGYDDGWGAGYVHEESSFLSKKALDIAIKNGDNIIIPKVGGSSVDEIVSKLKDNGYWIGMYLNDVPVDVSITRMAARFAKEGRWIDTRILHDVGRKPYDAIMRNKDAVDYVEWRDNNVGVGEEPRLVWKTGYPEEDLVLREGSGVVGRENRLGRGGQNVQTDDGLGSESQSVTLGNQTEPNTNTDRAGETQRGRSASGDVRYSMDDSAYMSAVESGDMETAQRMVDEAAKAAGYTIRGWHGTTNFFTVFDREHGNPEGDWGRGFYFTNNKDDVNANYASTEGPDLLAKIATLADRLEYFDDYADMSYEQREKIATEMLSEGNPRTISAALKITNPVVMGNGHGYRSTFLDFVEDYDEDTDEYGEPSGKLIEFVDAVKEIASDYAFGRDLATIDELYQYAFDYGGLEAQDAAKMVKHRLGEAEVSNENGELVGNDIVREAFAAIGYDAIIDNMVSIKFPRMAGMTRDTAHIIVNEPNQIKMTNPVTYDDNGNVIPLSKRFNQTNDDIRYSPEEWESLQQEYGTQYESAGSVRDTNVPRRTAPENKVSHSVPTVMGANPISEIREPTIKEATVGGKFSYVPLVNKVTQNAAEHKVESKGWSKSTRAFVNAVEAGRTGADLVATGAVLLNNASNSSDATGEEFIDLMQSYIKLLRNSAQAVQAAKILQQMTPEARLYGIQRDIERANDEAIKAGRTNVDGTGRGTGFNPVTGEFEGISLDPALVEAYKNAKTDEERNEILDEMAEDVASQMQSTKMDLWTAWRYLAMLGNFRTQVRNVLGNTMFQPARVIKESIAGLAEAALQRAGVDIERTTSLAVDRESWKAAGEIFRDYRDTIMAGGKYNDKSGTDFAGMVNSKKRVFKQTRYEKWNRTIGKALDKYQYLTDQAMDKGDLYFCEFTFRDALARFMAANHTTWNEASEELQDRAVNVAIREAAEATYRDNNKLAQLASQFLRGKNIPGWAKAIGEGVIPFRKTPVNIAKRAWEYSPLSIISNTITDIQAARGAKGKTKFARTGITANDVINQWAKTFTGTGLMLLGFGLSAMGRLIGKAPDDDKEKALFDQQGYQAYSMKIGNKWFTLDWAAPGSIPLFLGANLEQQAMEQGMSIDAVLDAITNIGDPLIEMSMLQGINDAFKNASSYGDDGAVVNFVTNALVSYLSQGLPTIAGQIKRATNNTRMTTYTDKNDAIPTSWQYVLGKASAKLPGEGYNQIPYIDAWGDPQENADTATWNVIQQLFSPSYVSEETHNATLEEVQRLYDATGDRGVIFDRPQKYFTLDKETKNLTADEYVTYALTRGQAAKAIMADLVNDKTYLAMSDEEKAEAVKMVYDYANQLGKAAVSDFTPQKWVLNGEEAAQKYNIPVSQYIELKEITSTIEATKDLDGEAIANTKGLKIMKALYDAGLTEKEAKALGKDFGVGEKVLGYSKQETLAEYQKIPTQAQLRQKAADDAAKAKVEATQTQHAQTLTASVQKSSMWNNATAEQQKSVEAAIKDLSRGNKDGQSYQADIDGGAQYGLDETEYMLFKLSLKMNDQPNANGNYGTITNAEREAAVRAVPGLSAAERNYLWIVSGGNQKSVPIW